MFKIHKLAAALVLDRYETWEGDTRICGPRRRAVNSENMTSWYRALERVY
jgi:hypothetical protein